MAIIEFIESEKEEVTVSLLDSIKFDGYYKSKLRDKMLQSDMHISAVDSIFANALKCAKYFAKPTEEKSLSKVLCLGKVQSGKTSFFISTIALAFDNGYEVAYLIGGTKKNLRDQNYERVSQEFSNNPNVVILDLNETNAFEINSYINSGKKLIIVVLKQTAKNKNLGFLDSITETLREMPSIVIDDEGDECTPGAPKTKSRTGKNGVTHDRIVEVLTNLNCCTFLSVTATPQANFLISTLDEISPDFLVLVEPGKGYTGGNEYHDSLLNPHTEIIDDVDDFVESIPDSFKRCFLYFIFACCVRRANKDYSRYSMLVHPSSFQIIHEDVNQKINSYFNSTKASILTPTHIAHTQRKNEFLELFNEYQNNNQTDLSFEAIWNEIPFVISSLESLEYNYMSADDSSGNLYKIYVGGNLLGRGLTIKNLVVTYIYRDAKISAIDTLYQRARWFGYKSKYFDLCKVFMPKDLFLKFIATVDNENDMWNMVNNYLLCNDNVKAMPRRFKLNSDKLILTRRTITKTITVERVNPGYSYDRSIYYLKTEKEKNVRLYEDFYKKYNSLGTEKIFSNNGYQAHLIIKMSYINFYNEFIKNYIFPKGSDFGHKGFEKILNDVNEKKIDDEIYVVIMRYKTKQFRSLETSFKIKELPQSYDNTSNYPGDKNLPGLNNKLHMQIHLVYTDKNKIEDYLPMLAFNNPLSETTIRYVTGDNYYESD